MQALPDLALSGSIDIARSNRKQQRGPHGAFRYFGKLAPDVTGHILDLSLDMAGDTDGIVVDVMCGSGTTLLEAHDRGLPSIGLDVNPVALLYSQVKTRAVDKGSLCELLSAVLAAPKAPSEVVESIFSATRNSERWFTDIARAEIARLRMAIEELPTSHERQVLLAVLLSKLRRISNASARTGRIFYDPMSAAPDVAQELADGIAAASSILPAANTSCSVAQGDARSLPIPSAVASVTFCHPPYFGLYRFSADVLRFELEIGGWSRSAVNGGEIEEGWKSGDVGRLDSYIADMGQVMTEGARVTKEGGVFSLIASNSTLGDRQLPVIDRLVEAAEEAQLSVVAHYERKAHHGSASYHRSARTDKVINQDHVVLFRKT